MNEIKYKTGADFWRDTAKKYGLQEADGICGRYLSMQTHLKQTEDEKQFCRELFVAMHEDVAGRAVCWKLSALSITCKRLTWLPLTRQSWR